MIPRSILRHYLLMYLPIFAFIVIVIHLVWHSYKKKAGPGYLFRRCMLTVLALSYISYISLAKLAVRVFQCKEVHDGTTEAERNQKTTLWDMDTSVECFKDSHSTLSIAVGVPLLCFSFFFPVLLALYLIRVRNLGRLESPHIQEIVGLFYRGYEEKYVYWDSLIMLRKALLAAILAFSHRLGGNLQGLLAVSVLLLSLFYQTRYDPFKRSLGNLNSLERASLLTSNFVFLSGIIIHDPQTEPKAVKILLETVIVICITAVLVILVMSLVDASVEQLRFTMMIEGVRCETLKTVDVLMAYIAFQSEKALQLAKNIALVSTTTKDGSGPSNLSESLA